jgi:hypothetical protein
MSERNSSKRKKNERFKCLKYYLAQCPAAAAMALPTNVDHTARQHNPPGRVVQGRGKMIPDQQKNIRRAKPVQIGERKERGAWNSPPAAEAAA